MSDRITLTGLAATACHGVLDFEKRIPQPFVLDISLDADLGPAGRSDDLEASLSYADVAARAVEVCSGEPVDLIETLAERVADACLAWEIVEAVDVTVHKPHAPAGVAFTPSTGALAGPSVSVRREQRRRVVVAMGTNLGRRVTTLRAALDSLRALEGFEVTQVSPLVETDP
ncbi:dihydroneopterin aldolase, partial [Dermacoccus sp. UBA1591]